MMKYLLFLSISIWLFSCKSSNEIIADWGETLIIGHKAASKTKQGETLAENSLEAVKYAYKNLDGIEVDIRASKDSTLWLIHDENINYNGKSLLFSSLSDKEIKNINYQTKGSIITLKQLFSFLAIQKDKKFVSLDMKVINNQFWLQEHDKWIDFITDSLSYFYKYYKPNSIIAVESWDINFLKTIEEKESNIETYLMIWNLLKENDILYAKKNNIDGLSCNIKDGLKKEIVNFAKSKNIKIQTWTINNAAVSQQILKCNPTTMQVDNTNYFIK